MIQLKEISKVDPEVAEAIEQEFDRQQSHLELIASENFVSMAVMAAMGSHLTNKYAEGYPGRRYYGGCQFVDVVENLAIERAKKLLGQNMPMSSLTLVLRLILQYTLPCSIPEIL